MCMVHTIIHLKNTQFHRDLSLKEITIQHTEISIQHTIGYLETQSER